VIDLGAARLLGTGHERACYVHPCDERLVIKVNRPAVRSRRQNHIDHFYLAALQLRGVPDTHLPRQHGFVSTTLGEGLVVDRIVNCDGSDAITMPQGLSHGQISRREARNMLAELYEHLLTHGVVMVDVGLANVVCRRVASGWAAVVIDGLGARHLGWKLRLRARWPFLARIKLRRQWRILEVALQRAVAARED
jgi:hypothetical protein